MARKDDKRMNVPHQGRCLWHRVGARSEFPTCHRTFICARDDGHLIYERRADMSIKWETELREQTEDDEADDVFQPGDSEDDFFSFSECASDPCLGDWLRPAF